MKKTYKAAVAAMAAVTAGLLALAILSPMPASAEGQASGPLVSASCGCQETSFGDLVADAVRDAAGTNIALVAAISFKAGSLQQGPLTLERVSSLLSNPDEVWAVSPLSGQQIRNALEHAVHSTPLPSSAFLQVSNLAFEYEPTADRGQRVTNVLVGGQPLDANRKYSVAMPLSLAKGGSGYFKFFTKENIEREGNAGLGATVVDYASKRGTVSYSGFGRITAR